jgi:hypothetical protein
VCHASFDLNRISTSSSQSRCSGLLGCAREDALAGDVDAFSSRSRKPGQKADWRGTSADNQDLSSVISQAQETTVSIQFSRHGMAALPASFPAAESPLVRRLVQAKDDPIKKRIRAWLMDLDDQQLSAFGFTPVDIAILRGCPERIHIR